MAKWLQNCRKKEQHENRVGTSTGPECKHAVPSNSDRCRKDSWGLPHAPCLLLMSTSDCAATTTERGRSRRRKRSGK
eukprot:744681-Pyramimonas_sp.AAC.1